MHRIKYTSEELLGLRDRLFPYIGLFLFNTSSRCILYSIINKTFSEGPWGYTWMSGWEISPALRQKAHKIDPESVYLILKEQLNVNRTILQHVYQTLYHMPYTELPLQLNHNNDAVRIITVWRLELGK